MTVPIRVSAPALTEDQERVWRSIIEFSRRMTAKWTIVGGQMAQLHAWQRHLAPARTTTDIDAGLGFRESPAVGVGATRVLADMGFAPGQPAPDGPAVRWVRGNENIEVLIPWGAGRDHADVNGARLLESHGIQQALERTEHVLLTLPDGSQGLIPRPTLLGAVVAKAAALSNVGDSRIHQHLSDLLELLAMLVDDDVEPRELRARDLHHIAVATSHLQRNSVRYLGADDPRSHRAVAGLALIRAAWAER